MSLPVPSNRNGSSLVGLRAPEFALPDPISSNTVPLESYRGQDVLLIFLRGTWCPYCVQQLQILKDNFDKLQAANTAVVGIVCQSQITVKLFLKSSPLPFPLLCDGSRVIAKAYGTYYYLSHEGFHLSHPALFILDKQQVITFAHIGRSMSDLPMDVLLEKFIRLLGETRSDKLSMEAP